MSPVATSSATPVRTNAQPVNRRTIDVISVPVLALLGLRQRQSNVSFKRNFAVLYHRSIRPHEHAVNLKDNVAG
jgi:hypothetical protein